MCRILSAVVLAAGFVSAVQAAPISGQGTWETTLQPRYYEGEVVAYYDTVLDITWLGDPVASSALKWPDASAWVSALAVGEAIDWRLPAVVPIDGVIFDPTFSNNGTTDFGTAKANVGWGFASELGHMYYVTLGNLGYFTPNDEAPSSQVEQPGWGLLNSGPFASNFGAPDFNPTFWTGVINLPNPTDAIFFEFGFGLQGSNLNTLQNDVRFAWAVHDGDPLRPVPLPAALPLFLAGGAVLVGAGVRGRCTTRVAG